MFGRKSVSFNFPEVTQFWEICVTQGMSQDLTDIPWVTHFPLVTQLFSVKKCITQGMPTVLEWNWTKRLNECNTWSNAVVNEKTFAEEKSKIYRLLSKNVFSLQPTIMHGFDMPAPFHGVTNWVLRFWWLNFQSAWFFLRPSNFFNSIFSTWITVTPWYRMTKAHFFFVIKNWYH